jgi:capsular exopolysaccharide synthesis family protein
LTDKGFRTPEEIRRRLGLPVIGHVPLLSPEPGAAEKQKAGQPTIDPFLVTYFRPKSVEAEAYRAVRTALYFSTQGGGHSVIQVTSPDMGDGKSTLVVNLAITIAQSGKRILLIDGDMRRPRLHKLLAKSAPTGLAAAVSGQVPWRDVVQETTVPGLSLLPCGPMPPNPSEVLTSPRFQQILEEVRQEYDFAIVDTPPLLAVTDPCVVAPRVDGVVLTIRLSKKSGPQAERAREVLTSLGVQVLGVVVNGVGRGERSGRYSAWQYEYSYAPSEYSYQADEQEEDYYETNGEAAAKESPKGHHHANGRNGVAGLLGRLTTWWR